MKTLDDVNVSGKLVFCRVDLNSPIVNGKVEKSARMVAHAETLKYLSKKGARVVVLAHQGRKGDADYTDLSQHYQIMKSLLKGINFIYVPDVVGEKAQQAVKSLKNGEVLLLENVRSLDDEKGYDSAEQCLNAQLIKTYEPVCDLFVLDAFSVAHRNQPSVTGFFRKGIIAGKILQKELESIDKISSFQGKALFVMGGSKAEDGIKIMKYWFNKLGNKVSFLLGGAIGNVFLIASGFEVGTGTINFLNKNENLSLVEEAKKLLTEHSENIILPIDVAYEVGGKRVECSVKKIPQTASIMDIGKKTISLFKKHIKSASRIMVNGPVGVYENPEFETGTKKILRAIASTSKKAFSLVGGGHTVSAIEKFKISKKKFGYISLAGKALIQYLCGEKLAGIEALSKNSTN